MVDVKLQIQPAQQIARPPAIKATWCSLILLHSNSILSWPKKTTTCSFCKKANRSLKRPLSQIRAKIQRWFWKGSPRKNCFRALKLIKLCPNGIKFTCNYWPDEVLDQVNGCHAHGFQVKSIRWVLACLRVGCVFGKVPWACFFAGPSRIDPFLIA